MTRQNGVAKSKKQKIALRTFAGVALSSIVAGFFLAAERFPEYQPVLAIAVVLQVFCGLEVGRMGTLEGRGFTQPLVLATAAVSVPAILGALHVDGPLPFADTELAGHVLLVVMAAWLARALGDFSVFAKLPRWIVPGVWVAAAVGFAFLGPEPKYVLAIFGAVALTTIALTVRGLRADYVSGPRNYRRDLVVTLALALWILVPLSALPIIWERTGARGMLALVLLSKVGDIAGYFVGNAIGKTRPFPKLSPGKTTAGCVGSLVAGALAGGALFWAGWIGGSFARGCLIGAVFNVAAQAGDLLESKVKRTTGVKDSSTWLGPSGGFLDVLDSLFLTIPTMLLLWPGGF